MKLLKQQNFWLVMVFVIMGILFYSSSQTYTQQSQVSNLHVWLADEPGKAFFAAHTFKYAGMLENARYNYFGYMEFLLRKMAHYSIYFALGMSWFLALKNRIKQPILTAFVAWMAATGYAGMDEFHQLLTSERTPLIQDVMLDSAGALTAVSFALLVAGIIYLRHRRAKR
ncbi:MAG: VanZ family protein [Lactobacillaceae bacterium]|jgi:VanZ family protein|nr:VanZ family protein [Lactobacillaceae bacterium]